MSFARKLTLLSAIVLAAIVGASAAQARTNVDVGLFFRTGSPYRGSSISVDFVSRPEYVRIPYSEVRYVDGGDCDVYSYGGWYYAYDDGYWYRSHDCDGPWGYVRYTSVPRQVIYVPERYRPRWVAVRGERYRPYTAHDCGQHRGWYKDYNGRHGGWRDHRFDNDRGRERSYRYDDRGYRGARYEDRGYRDPRWIDRDQVYSRDQDDDDQGDEDCQR